MCELLGGGETSRLYRKFKYEKRMVDSISVIIPDFGTSRDALCFRHT